MDNWYTPTTKYIDSSENKQSDIDHDNHSDEFDINCDHYNLSSDDNLFEKNTSIPQTPMNKGKNIKVLQRRNSQSLDGQGMVPMTPSNVYNVYGTMPPSNGRIYHREIRKTRYDSPILNRTKTLYLLICMSLLCVLSGVLAFCAAIS